MNVFKYFSYDIFSLRHLIVIFLFNLLSVVATAEPTPGSSLKTTQKCNEINASFDVIQDSNGGLTNSIVIDLKGIESPSVIISLVGPKKLFLKDVKENEIKNLGKGTYSLVITGRNESSSYCPKHFQVIIK